jgi:hypothetical protein
MCDVFSPPRPAAAKPALAKFYARAGQAARLEVHFFAEGFVRSQAVLLTESSEQIALRVRKSIPSRN